MIFSESVSFSKESAPASIVELTLFDKLSPVFSREFEAESAVEFTALSVLVALSLHATNAPIAKINKSFFIVIFVLLVIKYGLYTLSTKR